MEVKRCKKCNKSLPKGYKHKYCENCRNEKIKKIKDSGKVVLGLIVLVGDAAIGIVSNKNKSK